MSGRRLRWSAPVAGLLFAGVLFSQTPVVREVRNAASLAQPDPNGQGIAPRSIVAISGENLASETAEASGFPLPTTLAATRVLFNGQAAPLLYVSPTQINAQVPSSVWDPKTLGPVLAGPPAEVVVSTGSDRSAPLAVPVTRGGLGLFTRDASGCGQGTIFNVHADGTLSENRPDNSFDPKNDAALAVFGTGLGFIDVGGQPDGMPWRFDAKVDFRFVGFLGVDDGEGALPQRIFGNYSGPAPGRAGVDQVNLVPSIGPPWPRFDSEGRAILPEGCGVPLYVTQDANATTRSQAVAISIHSGGGQCVDPQGNSYGVFRWEHVEENGRVSDTLVIRLWQQPGLRLVTNTLRRLGSNPRAGIGLQAPPPPKVGPCLLVQPRVLDAGVITLRGPGVQPITVTADFLTPDVEYRVPLPAGAVRGGEYEIRTSGGVDVGPFVSTVQIPDPIQITSDLKPGTVVPSRASDTTLRWSGAPSEAWIRATLRAPFAPGLTFVRDGLSSAMAGSLTFISLPGASTNPQSDNAELTVEMFPDEELRFSAAGLTEGAIHTWRYEFRFPGLKVR